MFWLHVSHKSLSFGLSFKNYSLLILFHFSSLLHWRTVLPAFKQYLSTLLGVIFPIISFVNRNSIWIFITLSMSSTIFDFSVPYSRSINEFIFRNRQQKSRSNQWGINGRALVRHWWAIDESFDCRLAWGHYRETNGSDAFAAIDGTDVCINPVLRDLTIDSISRAIDQLIPSYNPSIWLDIKSFISYPISVRILWNFFLFFYSILLINRMT